MLLRQLRYFVSVVSRNSFTRAAEDLFVSQSAVSQQIRVMEEELGVALLIRRNRGFELTAAGLYCYQEGKKILEEVDRLRQETARIGQETSLRTKAGS